MKVLVTMSAAIAALCLLLGVPSSMPALSATSSVQGIVVPDTVHDKQPFSFSVAQTGQQEVDVSSVSGVVVQRVSADAYGRVFLAAGLPAGAYLISRAAAGGHAAEQVGRVDVQAGAAPNVPQQPLQVTNPPQAIRLDQTTSLAGHGFDPNYADTQVSLRGPGATQAPLVLAATEDQLKLAPLPQFVPGAAKLTVKNTTSGQTYGPQIVLAYTLHGNLVKTKLTSGADQTQLVVDAMPHELPMIVRATVASGPVDFGGGRKESDVITQNGQAIFLVHAEPGSGPFQVVYALSPAQQITAHDECRCSLKSGRCIPTEDYYCEETKTVGKWSCISTKE